MPYARKRQTRRRATSRSYAGAKRSYRVRSTSRKRKSRMSGGSRARSPRIVIQLVNPAAAPAEVGQKGAQLVRARF